VSLMEEVSEKELLEVLHYFQKGKSTGPDGWSIEFYMGFYDLLGSDILKVVEESRKNGHICWVCVISFARVVVLQGG
jgi:hypothetical protein